MFKKLLTFGLATLLLFGTLTSCAQTEDPPEAGMTGAETPSSSAPIDSVADSEAVTEETLDIPDKTYNNIELTFLTRDDEAEWTTHEIYSPGMTADSDNINNAVYERNLHILETYGVTILELKDKTSAHVNTVNLEISANSGDFAAIISNVSNSASLATNGALWNLRSDHVGYIDTTKSWWDRAMTEGMSIRNVLYFATGDLLTSDNDATFAMLFNKRIAEDAKLDDFYALVHNHEWTMDKFHACSVAAVRDNDGIAGLSYDQDISGFAYVSSAPGCFYFAGDITLCTKDENDIPIYQLDIDRASAITDLGKKLFDKSHAIDLHTVNQPGGLPTAGKLCFGGNHALFIGEVMQTVTRMRGYDVDFGIIPFPMFEKAQGCYYSVMHPTASVVSIPKTVTGEKLEMVASMIEAMAYHSVDTLTKQYYEINLKTRDSKDEKSGPMIDMILESRICDLSYYYGWGRGAYTSIAETMLPSSKKSVASLSQRFSSMITSDIEEVVEKIEEFEAEATGN